MKTPPQTLGLVLSSLEVLMSHFSLLCFVLASVFSLAGPREYRPDNPFQRLGVLSFLAGLLLLLGIILQGSLEIVLISITLMSAAAFWLYRVKKNPIPLIVFAPLITVILTLALLLKLQNYAGIYTLHSDSLLFTHVVGALVGEVFALLAAFAAFCLLFQHRLLRSKKLRHVLYNSLPAMDHMMATMNASLNIGFFFFSLATISGTVLVVSSEHPDPTSYTKLIWSFGVWTCYLITLSLRVLFRFGPQKIAKMSLFGFSLLTVAYFGFIF